jgi:hypothetical protein
MEKLGEQVETLETMIMFVDKCDSAWAHIYSRI